MLPGVAFRDWTEGGAAKHCRHMGLSAFEVGVSGVRVRG